MSTQITYDYVKLHSCGPTDKVFKRLGDKAYFKIKKVSPATTDITIDDQIIIEFNKLNYYNLTFTVYPKGCPMATLPINLEQLVTFPTTSLSILQGQNTITISGVIPVGTKLRIYTNPKLLDYFECVELYGLLGISNIATETARITTFDENTKVRYLPSTPSKLSLLPDVPYPLPGVNPLLPAQYPFPDSVFPWREAIIPHEKNQTFPIINPDFILTPDFPFGVTPFPPFPTPPLPNGTLNGYPDQYDKLRSVPDSVIFYIGYDAESIPPKKESWTLFLTNFEDRGYSGPLSLPEWQLANYQKKVYMNALSIDKLQFYLPKVEAFVNTAFSDVSIYGKPLISSFQENLVLFFLRMHIGNHNYPDYVIKWFSRFIEFIGIGDPNNPDRDILLMYGNTTSHSIFEYFRDKNIEIISNNDKSCIAYWWHQAGLSSKALVFECVHNIVAFSQFSNVIFSVVYAGIHPTNPLNPALPQYVNFLEKYASATTSDDKLNVVRESYRILAPNSASFSLVKPVLPDVNLVKSRHFHQSIMISNLPGTQAQQLGAYFTYNPNQYNENFRTNLDNLEGLPVMTNILETSITSPLDQETVVDNSTVPVRPIVPIFPKPTYAPFGLGYRRCAGEMLTYLITEKLFEKFSTIKFEQRIGTYPLISIAPLKRVEDDIFVKQI